MTTLAESGQVPVVAVGLISVEMMYGKHPSTFNSVRLLTTLAAPASRILDAMRDLFPIIWVV
jgi:membrane-bound lytic murein transglycosylase B